MSWKPFARVLVLKGERALKSARHNLKDGDYDSAVNRAYYAMFDIARAALLKVGVAEDKLPRTHNGVSEAFWIHAVHSGLVDRQLAAELSRTESLRIKADYTDLEIEPNIAAEVVERAELCQARENWLHLRQQKIDGAGPTLVTEQSAKPKKT